MENIKKITLNNFRNNPSEAFEFLKSDKNNIVEIIGDDKSSSVLLDMNAFIEKYGTTYETTTIDDFIII